jgi:hypothetical protein
MADVFVQLKFPDYEGVYTFIDASAKLNVGDQFEFAPERRDYRTVTVVGTERGFDGNLKSVNPITVKTPELT